MSEVNLRMFRSVLLTRLSYFCEIREVTSRVSKIIPPYLATYEALKHKNMPGDI